MDNLYNRYDIIKTILVTRASNGDIPEGEGTLTEAIDSNGDRIQIFQGSKTYIRKWMDRSTARDPFCYGDHPMTNDNPWFDTVVYGNNGAGDQFVIDSVNCKLQIIPHATPSYDNLWSSRRFDDGTSTSGRGILKDNEPFEWTVRTRYVEDVYAYANIDGGEFAIGLNTRDDAWNSPILEIRNTSRFRYYDSVSNIDLTGSVDLTANVVDEYIWFKFDKTTAGGGINSYYSFDGTNWTLVATETGFIGSESDLMPFFYSRPSNTTANITVEIDQFSFTGNSNINQVDGWSVWVTSTSHVHPSFVESFSSLSVHFNDITHLDTSDGFVIKARWDYGDTPRNRLQCSLIANNDIWEPTSDMLSWNGIDASQKTGQLQIRGWDGVGAFAQYDLVNRAPGLDLDQYVATTYGNGENYQGGECEMVFKPTSNKDGWTYTYKLIGYSVTGKVTEVTGSNYYKPARQHGDGKIRRLMVLLDTNAVPATHTYDIYLQPL